MQVSAQFAGGEVLIGRFLGDTVEHAGRRGHEVQATADFPDSLGTPDETTEASEQTLRGLEENGRQG
ncbi:DUF1932 domain-containing protein [Nocardiopsis ansamitocini]|uniref:DUF1932 domain-containing protein n=1 Tax=Nocardiopsis ansamitocini TaxID=1670832 RepID=UPI0025523C3C|nr:DUF1932 domain-containing protein [Nocardiopsis ansamitocini]